MAIARPRSVLAAGRSIESSPAAGGDAAGVSAPAAGFAAHAALYPVCWAYGRIPALSLADRTGARFYRGEDNRQVQAAIDEILSNGRPVGGYQSSPVRRDLYFYFFSTAFICMLAGTFL